MTKANPHRLRFPASPRIQPIRAAKERLDPLAGTMPNGAWRSFLLMKSAWRLHIGDVMPQGKVPVADNVAALSDNAEVRTAHFGTN